MKSSRLFSTAGGFQVHSARATISLRDVMAKPTSLAKQSPDLRLQGSVAVHGVYI
jgi:hypothetical protein